MSDRRGKEDGGSNNKGRAGGGGRNRPFSPSFLLEQLSQHVDTRSPEGRHKFKTTNRSALTVFYLHG